MKFHQSFPLEKSTIGPSRKNPSDAHDLAVVVKLCVFFKSYERPCPRWEKVDHKPEIRCADQSGSVESKMLVFY